MQIAVSKMVKLYGLGQTLGIPEGYRLQDNRRSIVGPEELKQRKIPLTPSDVEPSIFRLVGHHLIQLRHCVSRFQ